MGNLGRRAEPRPLKLRQARPGVARAASAGHGQRLHGLAAAGLVPLRPDGEQQAVRGPLRGPDGLAGGGEQGWGGAWLCVWRCLRCGLHAVLLSVGGEEHHK